MMAGSHSAEMYARFFAFKAGIDSLFLLVIVSLQAQSQVSPLLGPTVGPYGPAWY